MLESKHVSTLESRLSRLALCGLAASVTIGVVSVLILCHVS